MGSTPIKGSHVTLLRGLTITMVNHASYMGWSSKYYHLPKIAETMATKVSCTNHTLNSWGPSAVTPRGTMHLFFFWGGCDVHPLSSHKLCLKNSLPWGTKNTTTPSSGISSSSPMGTPGASCKTRSWRKTRWLPLEVYTPGSLTACAWKIMVGRQLSFGMVNLLALS